MDNEFLKSLKFIILRLEKTNKRMTLNTSVKWKISYPFSVYGNHLAEDGVKRMIVQI